MRRHDCRRTESGIGSVDSAVPRRGTRRAAGYHRGGDLLAVPAASRQGAGRLRLAGQVEKMLSAAGSAWRVDQRFTGLERRIDETVTEAVNMARKDARSDAAEHLAESWRAAYGRNPDPDKAYDEAVLAVEAVLCPLVSPNNQRPTLGTVIRDLRNQASQWELAIGDTGGNPAGIGRLVDMLALLWEGQSRHAGAANSRRQTQIEGEAAVHLAATLVQWINRAVLRRRSGS